jgi:hypothetical protein
VYKDVRLSLDIMNPNLSTGLFTSFHKQVRFAAVLMTVRNNINMLFEICLFNQLVEITERMKSRKHLFGLDVFRVALIKIIVSPIRRLINYELLKNLLHL